jgi:hypothetical protein
MEEHGFQVGDRVFIPRVQGSRGTVWEAKYADATHPESRYLVEPDDTPGYLYCAEGYELEPILSAAANATRGWQAPLPMRGDRL